MPNQIMIDPGPNDNSDFNHGYAHGKEKAHYEIRQATVDHDWTMCHCEPCITIRHILETIGIGYRPARRVRCVLCGRLHQFNEPHYEDCEGIT